MLRIPRSEPEKLNAMPGWVLLHGRRKVGKTYILLNHVPHDVYVMVRRDGVALSDDLPARRFDTGEALFDAIAPLVREGKTVIIDEVQRSKADLAQNLRKTVAQAVERFVGQLFCQLEGGQLEHSFDPELDFELTQGSKRTPSFVGEVRWGRYSESDVKSFAGRVELLACRKVFATPGKPPRGMVGDVEVLGAGDLRTLALAHGRDGAP